ncbi:Subtilisin-like protease SBT1.2 [Dichanthelium oligosanthes]|uniref:Subtilisin-like protease SBT1.2 n=1 Tax=Dichanthelium oligosanthes TaxID=888268 RepID=A0A1E5VUP3_9POAL|nr:Subtilisin-like protease SBT1.2 [Dichanthelium oligosanthes]
MESSKLSSLLLSLVPFLLLTVIVAQVIGEELTTFIVHVQPQEGHVLATADDRKTWYRSFLPEDGRLVHAYHHVASGFAARLTRDELDEVSAMPGFVGAVPDQMVELQTTHTPLFLGLDNAQKDTAAASHGGLGRDGGAGVIIGMIDSGVFPSHPSFSDDGMPPPPARWKGRCDFHGPAPACNNKLIGARSLVSWSNSSIDRSPIDDLGHGTHTASTAAGAVVQGAQVLGQGFGVASGMAPRTHIAVYKVCPKKGCALADILAGVDAAVDDGCDVISMSLATGSKPFHEDPIAIGTFGAIEKGVFVSMAASNSGPDASSVMNEAPWMLTVAASTMDRSIRSTVLLGNGLFFHGESTYQPADVSPSVSYPLVYAGASGKPFAELCGNGSLDGMDVEGKIVLCEIGAGPDYNITGEIKDSVVQSAGAAGMILANNFPQGHDTFADAHILPASHVDYAAGVAIKSYINSTADPVAQILFRGTMLGTSPAPSIAYFSSRGPSLQNPGILKPDVTGPGVNVLAAWPFQVGPPTARPLPGPYFNIISGTSMSTPHLSGIAALVKSRHPDWSPAAIKSAIMTTADVTDRAGNPILDEQRAPANWFATGAGHVNPDKAADPGLVYDIVPSDYIGYLCGLYTSQNVSVIARQAVNCAAVKVIPESMLNYPSISVAFPQAWNWSTPAVVERTVRNVGEVPSVYYAAVDMLDDDVTVGVYPRELVFTEVNQEQSFQVVVWPGKNGAKVVQGALRWMSDTYTVRSPMSISFA